MKTIKSISVIFFFMLAMFIQPSTVEARVQAVIVIRVRHAPPPLPYYEQPFCPVDGYLWTPGYWAWNGDDYYWVPGQWVEPPEYGYLWTPCYWGFSGGYYGFHNGYWGRNIGYYGGVNYGYGYGGSGFYGGRWSGNHFQYNTAVMNINRNIVRNTYVDRTNVTNNRSVNRPSFNGPGGVIRKPSARENVAMREKRTQPTSVQTSHQQASSKDRNQFVSVNKGRPAAANINKVNGQGSRPQTQQGTSASRKPANRPTNAVGNKPATNRPAANGQLNNQKNQSAQPNQDNRPVRQQAQPAQSAPKQQQVNQQQRQQAQPQQQRQQAAPQQQQRQQQAQPQQQQQQQQAQPQQQQRQQNDKRQER
jgi:hypothetical protein